ncbi:hypothetical protein C1645_785410 [Glomus cerebriforme]|uniref:Uncharacterized protein n=1 Tax=Glomus cerebriforme TaxID=658196 RepID=A0A397SMG9_9GLOM|nr:hypothetical protein C1645_785410 [Glomus cerebriforme]
MILKSHILINIIIILVFLLTFTYSIPVIEQDIGRFYCRNETNPNLRCCPVLALRKNFQNSISIILINKSGYNMNLAVASLENGYWVNSFNIKCEPQTDPLKNDQSEVFSSATSTSYYNFRGFTTFIIDDDISSTFTIFWNRSSPTIQYNDYSFDFLPEKKYKVEAQRCFKDSILQVTVYVATDATKASIISFTSILIFIAILQFIILCFFRFSFKEGASKKSLATKLQQTYNFF